jgi:hypothetical protein
MVILIMSTAHSAKPKSVNLRFESLMVIIDPGSECRLFSECGPRSKSRNKKMKKILTEKFEFLYLIKNCNISTFASIEDFYAPAEAFCYPERTSSFLSMSFYTLFLCCR